MAHIKKKFTFDDPEDSYWNESGSNSSSLFDDLPSKQWAARAAVDNLFEQREQFSTKTPQQSSTLVQPVSNPIGVNNIQTREAVNEFINHEKADFKLEVETSPLHAGGPSAASVVSECSVSSLPSDAHRLDLDYSRLKAEHRKLQRHLEAVRHDRYRAPDVREAVRRLLKGDPVSLEWYRSKEEKVQLLDAAIDIVDGNVILAVVLFLKSTLMDSLFRDLLLRKPQAADEYVAYLKTTRDCDELATTLFALGRNADAAMVEFSAAIRHQVSEQKVQALKKCVRSGFSDPMLAPDAAVVTDYISLLERQIPINVADDQSKNPIFTAFPKNASLIGKSVIATYYYCCLYHYDDPVHSLSNPSGIQNLFRLTEKESVWINVSALAKQSRWPDVERVLQPKSLLGSLQSRATSNSPKLSCPFGWQNLFHILYFNSTAPPKDLSCRILRAVSDADQRLRLAEKYDVCEIVIECLVAQRDRVKLATYASTLKPHTPDAYKASAALNNTGTKWKN
ncbi:Spermatogenesis-defective protein 39 [Trichostrongylus colubriformis]|uniref:Spermatogenesis-defective protein 39 n=1 Tax=Trichostrongylus colubriformis TaxID=6319 RepID=A0AAN8IKR1_TRICO